MSNNSLDLQQLRHSAAHLVGHAVSELFPGTLLTIGPATENGFFYDCLPTRSIKEEDLVAITMRMNELVKKNIPLTHRLISRTEAENLFANNKFKLELLKDIPDDAIGLAEQGDFYDLCRGGHVHSTGQLAHFKLTTISGSYWRADKSRDVLQRISGIVFWTAEELAEYERIQEERLKFDHRRIGKQLDLFSFHEEGIGFPFFHPHGKRVINALTSHMRTIHRLHGYEEVSTPTMLSDELWKQSGHYAHYRQNMYFCEIDEQSYAVKPMNCPGAILIYKTRPRSYRELPLRLAEFGHVHRHELSGVLHGLMRVRAFTQDDAHIFCMPSQIEQEIRTILSLIEATLTKAGFGKPAIAVSTKPESAMGSDALWDQATNALTSALDSLEMPYTIKPGEGAFYGPKIEIVIKDSMNREWQCGTIQVDFFQPENFDIQYVASSGERERPVIIHQAIFGSLERFLAILLEHHKGTLPFWLAPVQTRILTITDACAEYAEGIKQKLIHAGIRAEYTPSSDPISGQIKTAQGDRIPWMIVVGSKEVAAETVTLRTLDGKQEFGLSVATLIERAASLN